MFRHYLLEEREGRCGGGRGVGEGRGPFGGGGGHRGRWGGRGEGFGGMGRGGFGGGRERMFDSGVMRLVILQQLAEEPSYGYQLIKTLEERMAGGYRPSAGVIYPTLTMLEEQGLTSATTNEAGKKVYAVTEEGHAFLKENKERLDELKSLMNEAGRGFKRGRSPELMESFMRLREAVGIKVKREGATAEQLKKIADIIKAAAKSIDEL
jgi:DNA-binding PadR family transcriptional regulator